MGILPLDGTPNAIVVQTAMAGDDQKATMCVSTPGGLDGDARVRRVLVGLVFRLHHRVAQSAAKLRRFSLLERAVAS